LRILEKEGLRRIFGLVEEKVKGNDENNTIKSYANLKVLA
jgi:hypothetical protein